MGERDLENLLVKYDLNRSSTSILGSQAPYNITHKANISIHLYCLSSYIYVYIYTCIYIYVNMYKVVYIYEYIYIYI